MAKKKGSDTVEHNEIIVQKSMEEIMHDSMMPYAEHVILERALPRVEDGLKPVQRRILYTMLELSTTPDKPHRKCARIVGDCLGKYHPHGDSSVYDAMVRMAQGFNMREMLVDGHGNFGSVDGDSAAAMRYTEARMTPLALELLRDLEKDTVTFSLNFDDTLKEPDMLPGRFPNLLVNGASGIAVGLATNIPPHNLREAIDATIAFLDNPDISLPALMVKMPSPDFPTGGQLLRSDEIEKAYQTGRGRLLVRAKVSIEDASAGKKNLVITELPYQVNKATLLEKILKVSEERKGLLSGISDIRDESDRMGMRAVIELKKDVDALKILRLLYRVSDLQVTFGVNMVAIADGRPVQMGLIQILDRYVTHQKNVVTRRTEYDRNQAKAREHILAGLMIAVDQLDAIIVLIRASKNPKEAREGLMKTFQLTEIQAQAILDMRLQRLTGLEILALRKEYDQLVKLIARLESILHSEKKLISVIREELMEIRDRYGNVRRTELITPEAEQKEEDEPSIVSEPCAIVLTRAGFFKRMPPKVYAKKEETEDAVAQEFSVTTGTRLLLFTNKGACCVLDAEQIPECKWKDRGALPQSLIVGFEKGESIICVLPREGVEQTLTFATRGGMLKRTKRAEYGARRGKLVAINLKAEDVLLSVHAHKEACDLLLLTRNALSLRFCEDELPVNGRATAGVKGITLEGGDQVIFAGLLPEAGEVVLVTDRGYAKRCLNVDLEKQKRGGKGVRAFALNKNGNNGNCIVYASPVTESYCFTLTLADLSVHTLSTEEVLIESKTGRGKPVVPALLDNPVLTGARVDEQ